MPLNNSIRYKRSFVNINPQSNTDFTQVTCTVRFYYTLTIYNLQFTIYNLQLTIYNLQFTIYNLQFTIYNLQFTIYNLQFTIYNLQFTIYNLQFYLSAKFEANCESPPGVIEENIDTYRNTR